MAFENNKKIKNFLDSMMIHPSGLNTLIISFDDFLKNLKITKDEYIDAIRCTLKKDKVFLKRNLCDININPYNKMMLTMHQANMDIQYILDPYACVTYIVNYINKSNSGLSKLMAEAQAQIRDQKDLLTKEKLRKLGNLFLGSTEVSVHEAAYHTLGLRLTNSSVSEVFVNTFPPEQRSRMTKSKFELRDLNPEDKNVFVDGLLEHYSKRSLDLKDVSLAAYATQYSYRKLTGENPKIPKNAYLQIDNLGYVVKLRKQKLLLFRNYSRHTEPANFYREMVMLFLPWRIESMELINLNIEKKFMDNFEKIKNERSKFIKIDTNQLNLYVENIVAAKNIEIQNNVTAERN